MANILDAIGLSSTDALHKVIGNTFIVEMGIVKDIPTEGIVTVEMSASTDAESIVVTNCILANIASSAITINIKPAIDDKVIVLFPRRYAGTMFNPETNETVISEVITGYTITGGIAILLNQFNTTAHKNLLTVDAGTLALTLLEGKFTLTLDSDSALNVTANNASLSIDKDSALTLKANNTSIAVSKDDEVSIDNGKKAKISIDKDSALTLKANNTSIAVSKDDKVSIDNRKAKISIDKDGNVTIDAMSGKVSLKNSNANLYTILNGMLTILNSSLATQGSPASHVVVPQQFRQQVQQLGQLMQ